MNAFNVNFWGQNKAWWLLLCVGILMVICGFAYTFFPVIGYAVASTLFGWMLILAAFVQICFAAGANRPQGWVWWLAGGVIDMFVGFMLVRSITLAEIVFPYFLAFVFLYWGVASLLSAVHQRRRSSWWINLINGILLLIIGFFFISSGYEQNLTMVTFLVSISFIYWGMSLAITSYDLRPVDNK